MVEGDWAVVDGACMYVIRHGGVFHIILHALKYSIYMVDIQACSLKMYWFEGALG